MHWLSSSRVRLGLIVNVLYFLSLLMPSAQQHARGHMWARTFERHTERLRSEKLPDYAPLPAHMLMAPLKAETHYSKTTDQLDVFLTRDLLLVRRRGHTLLLSPTYYVTKVRNPERPRSVLMNFSSFSHEKFYDRNSPFVITADGDELWRYGTRGLGDETPWNAKALYSSATDDKGQVVETLGHEISYDIFGRIARARRVTFVLGPDTVELSPEQIEALRDMHRRLP